MSNFQRILDILQEGNVSKYIKALENAKSRKELDKAWSKCLNNKDGLENYDIADLRSTYDRMKEKF